MDLEPSFSNNIEEQGLVTTRDLSGKQNFQYDHDEKPIGKKINFDDQPIGMKSAFEIEEFPPDANPNPVSTNEKPEEAPLPNRLKSKVFKTRQQAFEELTEIYKTKSPSEPGYMEQVAELPDFIVDSHPGAQEKALICMRVYLEKNERIGFSVRDCLKSLFEKCLTQPKPNIKKVSYEIMFSIYEKGEKGAVLDSVLEMLSNKNQKVASGAIGALLELLVNYGPTGVDNFKTFFAELEKMMASTVSSIRTETANLIKEIYKWMGELIRPFISKFKKAQIDEIEKFIQEWQKSEMVPLREEFVTKTFHGGKKPQGANIKGGSSETDPYDIFDAVDIFGKFNEAWSEQLLAIAKWSDKKDKIEEFNSAASVPKLTPSNYHCVVGALKKLLNDSNVNVVQSAIKALGLLAKGLRKNFQISAKSLFLLIASKFKEKKNNIIEESHKTLESFLYCISLEDVVEDVKEMLNDKTASGKVNIIQWLDKFMEKAKKTIKKHLPVIKSLLPLIKGLHEDSTVEVRDTTLNFLGRIKATFGEDVLPGLFTNIVAQKMSKINECYKKYISEDGGTVPSATTDTTSNKLELNNGKKAVAQNIPSKAQASSNNKPETVGSLNQKSAGSAINNNNSNNNNGNKTQSKGGSAGLGGGGTQEMVSGMSVDDAEKVLEEEIEIMGIFNSVEQNSGWKEKQTMIQKLIELGNKCCQQSNTFEAVFKILGKKLKEFKETNPNLNKDIFCLLQMVFDLENAHGQKIDEPFSKGTIKSLSVFLSERLSEGVKYTESCLQVIRKTCEIHPPKLVISNLVSVILGSQGDDVKKANPKVLTELSNLLKKFAETHSVRWFPLREAMDFCKFTITSPNSTVRIAATSLLTSIFEQSGNQLRSYLKDLPPNIQKNIDTEFEKVTLLSESEIHSRANSLKFRKDLATGGKDIGKTINSMSSGNVMESLWEGTPKADISAEVPKLLKKLNNETDWKVKKEGIDDLERLLNASNSRISVNGLGELVNSLKKGLKDRKNKSLLRNFVTVSGRLAESAGREFLHFAKLIINPLMQSLSDKMALVRIDVIAAVEKFSNSLGPEFIFNQVCFLLLNSDKDQSVELRSELISWLLRNQDIFSRVELRGLVRPILDFIIDKNKDIRMQGEQLLEKTMRILTPEPFLQGIKDFKVATVQQIKPIIEKYIVPESYASMEIEEEEHNSRKGVPNISQVQLPNNNGMNPMNSGYPQPQTYYQPMQNSQMSSINSGPQPKKTPLRSNNKQVLPVAPSLPVVSSEQKIKASNPQMSNAQYGFQQISPIHQQNQLGMAPREEIFQSKPGPLNYIHKPIFSSSRESRLKTEPMWPIDEINDDHLEKLKEDLKGKIDEDLRKKMFSADVRKNMEALKVILNRGLEQIDAVGNSDLLIKWLFVRSFNNLHSDILADVVFILEKLVEILSKAKIKLHESEVFVLCGVIKEVFSSNLDNKFLNICCDIVEKVCVSLYAAFDVASFWVHILESTKQKKLRVNIVSFLIKKVLINYCGKEEIKNLIRIPEVYNSFELIQDIKRVHGNEATVGFLQADNSKVQSNIDADISFQNPEQERDAIILANFNRNVEAFQVANINEQITAIRFLSEVLEDQAFWKEPFTLKFKDLSLTLNNSLCAYFERKNALPENFLIFFLNFLQKIYSHSEFLRNLCSETLKTVSETILSTMLKEDEGRERNQGSPFGSLKQVQTSNSNDSPVKHLNSIMLKILENASPDLLYTMLFDLLIEHRKKTSYSKFIGLTVKCILKLTKVFENILPMIKVENLILKFHEYLSSVTNEKNRNEDIGVKTIKTILTELIKLKGVEIYNIYKAVMSTQTIVDSCLNRWIDALLNQNQMLVSSANRMKFETTPIKGSKEPENTNTTDYSRTQLLANLAKELKGSPEPSEPVVKRLFFMILENKGVDLSALFKEIGKEQADKVKILLQELKSKEEIDQGKNLDFMFSCSDSGSLPNCSGVSNSLGTFDRSFQTLSNPNSQSSQSSFSPLGEKRIKDNTSSAGNSKEPLGHNNTLINEDTSQNFNQQQSGMFKSSEYFMKKLEDLRTIRLPQENGVVGASNSNV